MGLPVHVVGCEEEIVAASVRPLRIIAAVHDSQLSAEILKLRTPGLDSMVGDVRVAADQVIHAHGLLRHMEHRVFLSECNDLLCELEQVPICLQKPPVQPGNGVILAVGIIISSLCSAEFISRQKERRALA